MDTTKVNDIDLFFFRFSSYAGSENQFLKDLINDEIERSDRYHFSKDKHQFIICRGILRNLLAENTGINPGKIILDYNAYGKPQLNKAQNPKKYHFNISHSEDFGLIALSNKNEVGVDIELVKELSDMDSIISYQFSEREIELYSRSESKQKFFFDLWTQKEAIVKATGEGLSLSLKNWSINPHLMNYNIDINSNSFSVQKLDLDTDYSAALAVKK